jgi:hypothetical protein
MLQENGTQMTLILADQNPIGGDQRHLRHLRAILNDTQMSAEKKRRSVV